MTKPSVKELITKTVIEQIPSNVWTFDEAMKKWWMTVRSDRGLRLTDMGDLSFRHAEIEFYEYDLTIAKEQSLHATMLDLSKKLKCPYYLGARKETNKKTQPYVRLYDSRVAVMVSLYGNIMDYLKSIKERS